MSLQKEKLKKTIIKIPKKIYICGKDTDLIKKYSYQKWKKINPEYEIDIYDDDMCRKFIKKHYGDNYVDVFNYLQHGPIKADFWRLCILYKYGGVYSDADIEPLVPLADFFEKQTSLVIGGSFMTVFNFNPCFFACRKKFPVIKKCIQWYVEKYVNKVPYNYWDFSVMKSFSQCLKIKNYNRNEGVYNTEYGKIQILKDNWGDYFYDNYFSYKGKRILNTRMEEWDYETHTFSKKNIEIKETLKKHNALNKKSENGWCPRTPVVALPWTHERLMTIPNKKININKIIFKYFNYANISFLLFIYVTYLREKINPLLEEIIME